MERLFIYNTDFDSGLEYLPGSLKELYCSTSERPESKIKNLEQELKKFGEPSNDNYINLLKSWREWKEEFIDSPAQQWLDEEYPKESECKRAADDKGWDGSNGWDNEFKRREEIIKLDISQQDLGKGLKLEGFSKLENLNCSENGLSNLDLTNCPKLSQLKCDQNVLKNLNLLKSADRLTILQIQNNPSLSQGLNIFAFFKELTRLDIHNCPFEGSLRPLQSLNKLEWLDISDTNLREGLEYLPASCKEICCNNNNYKRKSFKIMEELDKGRCLIETKEGKHYDLDKWRINKANNDTSSIVPLERLFVIRGNLKQFINKWDKSVEDDWYDRLEKFVKWTKASSNLSEINRLKPPKELSRHRKVYMGTQFIGRGIAVTGVVLTFQDHGAIGGGVLGAYPFAELAISNINGKINARENKWNEFLDDADNFSDNFNELLGITRGIKVDDNKLGKVNEEFRKLKQRVNEFLDEYDTVEKNEEIDLEELIGKRTDLAKDIDKNNKESKLQVIIESMKKLEDQIIAYRQGIDRETEEITIQNQLEQTSINITNEEFSQLSSQVGLLDKSKQKEIIEDPQEQSSTQAQIQIPPK